MNEAMKPIGRVETPYGAMRVLAGRYAFGGGVAILLENEEGVPFTDFSRNVARCQMVAEGEFHVHTWFPNEDLVGPLLASGLFEDTGRRTPTGHV